MSFESLTEIKTIVIRHCLKPEFMDYQYKQHLIEFIRQQYEKKSFKDYGYIMEILGIVRILRQEIMSIIPNNYFVLEVRVRSFYPKIGQSFFMKIDRIFPHGIFFMEDMIRILVPLSLNEQIVIQKDFSSWYVQDKKSGKIYRKNDLFFLELMDVRFEKDGFSCIGKLGDQENSKPCET